MEITLLWSTTNECATKFPTMRKLAENAQFWNALRIPGFLLVRYARTLQIIYTGAGAIGWPMPYWAAIFLQKIWIWISGLFLSAQLAAKFFFTFNFRHPQKYSFYSLVSWSLRAVTIPLWSRRQVSSCFNKWVPRVLVTFAVSNATLWSSTSCWSKLPKGANEWVFVG